MYVVKGDVGGREKFKYKMLLCLEENSKSMKKFQAVCALIKTGHEG